MTIRAAQTNNKSVVAANIVIHKTPTITFDKMLQLTCKQVDHLGFTFRHEAGFRELVQVVEQLVPGAKVTMRLKSVGRQSLIFKGSKTRGLLLE
jgi:hypothetical protein